MKITKLHAENVHEYLPIDVTFYDDLTFLTGLNGSGKTSALRLLMALLSPNIQELGSISFSLAEVTVWDNGSEVVVTATKTPEGVQLKVTSIDEPLCINTSELELFIEAKHSDEPRLQKRELYQSHPVFQSISKMSTPMFLGLDRRFFIPGFMVENPDDLRRREYMSRRFWPEDLTIRGASPSASLIEVNYLVVTCMQDIRALQEKLDDRLRTEFFKKAFEYKTGNFWGKNFTPPSKDEINTYRQQFAKIEQAGEVKQFPVPEIQDALSHFFESMNRVIESLAQSAQSKKTKDKKITGKTKKNSQDINQDYLEWIINRPQADRIIEHLDMLNKYIENRNSLRDPINRFLSLVNGFLHQTQKQVDVGNQGQLTVSVVGKSVQRAISALSSGERQLLIMLAHLSLNPNLVGSGIFIVDEPELSLHIDWQEKFVDAIREANPNVQLILATHSPAIILDRIESCRSLS